MADRSRSERGSVLALMPAAVLVFVVLGSLAVDAALVFLGEREVANLAAAVANDAATQALDLEVYYATGEIRLDPALVDAVAAAALSRAVHPNLDDLVIEAVVIDDDVVLVRAEARVASLFSRVLPDGVESRAVAASAEATAERG